MTSRLKAKKNRIPLGIVAFLLLVTFSAAAQTNVPTTVVVTNTIPAAPKTGPTRFESDIQAFLRRDATNPPPKGIILFTGSSTFTFWNTLKTQMEPLPVFNRAFGGSQTADLLYYMDDVVLPYEPSVIVVYCGTNDFDPQSSSGEPTFERTRTFFERVRARLPRTRIVYVSIVRSPIRKQYWELMDSANALVKEYCSAHKGYTFIDVNPLLANENGEPRLELFNGDKLHFNAAGYEVLAEVVKPAVEAAWNAK